LNIQIINKIKSLENMKKSLFILAILVTGFAGSSSVQAQKFMTKNGNVKFYSETPVETIEASNNQVMAALDTKTGDLVFKILIKSFQFPKALMQEHFNENYMESDKFPNATFQGKITNLSEINLFKPGMYDAIVEGDLTIHGVTKKISERGTFTVDAGDKIKGNSQFSVKPADYGIKIPELVAKNIAESMAITVDVEMTKVQQ